MFQKRKILEINVKQSDYKLSEKWTVKIWREQKLLSSKELKQKCSNGRNYKRERKCCKITKRSFENLIMSVENKLNDRQVNFFNELLQIIKEFTSN